jgi:hypothetical protein
MADAGKNPNIPSYVIYCDESCHDLTAHHRFMAIGGLQTPRSRKTDLSRQLRQLLRSRKLNSEVKWSKVSNKKLTDYQKVVDFFFDHAEFSFRAIVVEQAKVKMELHGKDRELASYKFYYEMLEKWLQTDNEYLILLDYKSNRGADRYKTLKMFLERYLRGKAWIHDLTVISSKETPLAQLCDLLTGAVAADWNGPKAGSAKEALANHIAFRLGRSTLKAPTVLSEDKFNIFKINLG